jgi:hypothetical protein
MGGECGDGVVLDTVGRLGYGHGDHGPDGTPVGATY